MSEERPKLDYTTLRGACVLNVERKENGLQITGREWKSAMDLRVTILMTILFLFMAILISSSLFERSAFRLARIGIGKIEYFTKPVAMVVTAIIFIVCVLTIWRDLRKRQGAHERLIIEGPQLTIVSPISIRMIRRMPRTKICRVVARDSGLFTFCGAQRGDIVLRTTWSKMIVFRDIPMTEAQEIGRLLMTELSHIPPEESGARKL